MNVSDRELAAFVADALDPPRREEIARALAASPALRKRRDALSQQSPPPRHSTRPALTMPPPGVGLLSGAPVAVMGEALPWVRVTMPASGADDDRVVALERREGLWEVVSPLEPGEVVTAGELPVEGGLRQLDLGASPGAERLGVVLVPSRVPIPWEKPHEQRWEEILAEAFSEGWPSGTVNVRAQSA